jgi:hypothetical protein
MNLITAISKPTVIQTLNQILLISRDKNQGESPNGKDIC